MYAVTGFGSFSNIRADKNQRGGFDSVLQAVKISTAALFAASLLISILYGGAPEKVDGEYVIISHNKVIRTLGELEYKLLCINEGAFMSFGACSLFSSVLLYARRHLPKNSENTK